MTAHIIDRRELFRGAAALGLGSALGLAPFARALAATPAPHEWPTVTALIERYVSKRAIPGAIAAMGWGAKPPRFIARGTQGFEDRDPDGPESLFRAYSMTKPLTGMIAMMLIDEGKLKLDQPLSDFAPEFATMQVAVDPDKSLDAVPAKTAITIRHLMTHTSGLGYAVIGRNKVADELARQGLNPAEVSRRKLPGFTDFPATPGPDEFLRRTAKVPLVAEPGTKWRYSMGLDVLGIVIARVTGKPGLDAVMAERLFEPLGMKHSYFQVPDGEAPHLSTNYVMIAGVPVPIDGPKDSIYRSPPAFAFGGSGLVATPADYDRFLAMVLNKGSHGGKRVMSEAAVAMGTSDLLPPGTDTKGTYIDGQRFGAGGVVGAGKDAGFYGWSGAAATAGFAQMRLGLRAGLYTQFMPSDALPLMAEFPKAVGADLVAMGKAPDLASAGVVR